MLLLTMNINSSMDDNVVFPEPVALLHTGHPGRPKKIIDVEFLVEAVSNSWQIKLTELAEMLGIHRNTLRLYMKHHGVERKYSELTNVDLDLLVTEFKKNKPDSGIRYIVGFLRRHGLRVQYRRVVESLRRVDGLGQVLRD
jgi:hypothetical protein